MWLDIVMRSEDIAGTARTGTLDKCSYNCQP